MSLEQDAPHDAVRDAERAVRADPGHAAGYDRLARALLDAERFADAEQAARTADMLAPGGPHRLLVLAAAQAGLGFPHRSRRTLLAVLEVDPGNDEAKRLLARLRPPARRIVLGSSGNRATVVPALVMVLVGTVLLLRQVTVVAVACLTLAVVLLLGGFPGNGSGRR